LLQASSETGRTPVVTAQCGIAFKALTAKMRFFKNHYFLVPPLTEADLISLAYRNGKNQVGPFCPAFSAVIP
jgi:hypothetical protein